MGNTNNGRKGDAADWCDHSIDVDELGMFARSREHHHHGVLTRKMNETNAVHVGKRQSGDGVRKLSSAEGKKASDGTSARGYTVSKKAAEATYGTESKTGIDYPPSAYQDELEKLYRRHRELLAIQEASIAAADFKAKHGSSPKMSPRKS